MEDINYIKHLNGVFMQFSKDTRLNPTHISLYIALFQVWNNNFFKDEFYMSREEVMSYAKIGSKTTYHRCIRELSDWSYLLYMPTHNPFKGSRVKMFNFGTSDEQVLDPCCTKIETSNGQALVSINKHIQTIENNKNINKPENLKNLKAKDFKTKDKHPEVVPYQDNLKTSSDKNYNEPL